MLERSAQELVGKAFHAFATGKELASMVGELDMLVTRLENFIQRRFDNLPEIAPDFRAKNDRDRYIEALLTLRDRSTEFKEGMHGLHRVAAEKGMACYVVPRFVDEEGHFQRLMDGGKLTARLSLREGSDMAGSTKLPQITYPSSNSSSIQDFNALQNSTSKG